MSEVFIAIKGYEGLYEISNKGNIKSLQKYRGTGYSCFIPERLMQPKSNGLGYLRIFLSKNSIKEPFYIHRLVAQHFVENSDGLPEVNHENGDKNCNEYWNLKWCTRKENEEHAWNTGLKTMIGSNHFRSIGIAQLDLKGNVIKEWVNGSEVQRVLGYSTSHISKCCRNSSKTAYGFKWAYL